MNGNKVNPKDQFYFDKLYNSNNGQIIGIKDIKELPQLDEIMKDLMDADENVPSDLDFFDSNQEH